MIPSLVVPRIDLPDAVQVATGFRAITPTVLFGLRLWAAVSLALYIAFALELDNAYWAGASAAIVCQPSLGASLRKGWFRLVGTVVGALAIVVLTGCFPQQRSGFLLGLAIWCAVCGLAATLLRNFAGYAAALAGVTATIIAGDELGAVGGADSDTVFLFAITRASEICIGIICAGFVLAGTDFGGARRRLATQLAAISAEVASGLVATFLHTGPEPLQTRSVRCDLIRRVTALDPIVDETLGESSELRPHSHILQGSIQGLFVALSRWRTMALHRELLPSDQGQREADAIFRNIPQELQSMSTRLGSASWVAHPSVVRRACTHAIRALVGLAARTPSPRFFADRTAEGLLGIRRAIDGLVLLSDPTRTSRGARADELRIPDWLPALVNAVRAFVTIGAVELFWIATAWPSGAQAIVFAAIAVLIFAAKGDQAYATTVSFIIGAGLIVAVTAMVKFALLPGVTSFAGLTLAIGLVLVPAGSLLAYLQSPTFTAMIVVFLPLLAPANHMNYDLVQFSNEALAIVSGVGFAAVAFRLLPPLSPALRTRRLLTLTLRDLCLLAAGKNPHTASEWERSICSRLAVLPDQAEPQQRAQLIAALAVGTEIVKLRHIGRRFDLKIELDAALDALAEGAGSAAIEHLARFDRELTALPSTATEERARSRARAAILAISESLARHASYFNLVAAK
jgi:uncharacterized membrane protein YccC